MHKHCSLGKSFYHYKSKIITASYKDIVMAMAHQVLELLIFIIFARMTYSKTVSEGLDTPSGRPSRYCLSWRLAVEANNVRAWRTVPPQCLRHVENYITGSQYKRDIDLIDDQIGVYIEGINMLEDGMDAWILDVDDTCVSNLLYYRGRRYGCDPFDAPGFKAWAARSECPAIPTMLGLFQRLIEAGFKVILLTGRDKESLGEATVANLRSQGYIGYERLIMRSETDRGLSAVTFKSAIRKQLVEQGYRIWGNVGDQWSDIQGEFAGNRTFKLPNPMYFVP